jgi:hypothetical protein
MKSTCGLTSDGEELNRLWMLERSLEIGEHNHHNLYFYPNPTPPSTVKPNYFDQGRGPW